MVHITEVTGSGHWYWRGYQNYGTAPTDTTKWRPFVVDISRHLRYLNWPSAAREIYGGKNLPAGNNIPTVVLKFDNEEGNGGALRFASEDDATVMGWIGGTNHVAGGDYKVNKKVEVLFGNSTAVYNAWKAQFGY